MREPSPGASNSRGSTNSLNNGAVTKNMGFQQQISAEHLPWSSPAISLPGNCNSILASEPRSPLERSTSNASALTSLCADLSPSDSHFFEVLYVGKVRISQRKVPDSLIDDALFKFAQHEAEKMSNQRRHSLMSSTETSVYSTDSTDNIDSDLKTEPNDGLHLPSKTSLQSDINKLKNVVNSCSGNAVNNEIDKEFDVFTKERVEHNGEIRKPSQIPLEPSVLMLNIPAKKNLDILNEDDEKKDEIMSIISETASSITQFCQNSIKIDGIETVGDMNPFSEHVQDKENIEYSTNSQIKEDLKTADIKVNSLAEKKLIREDSPAPNVDGIPRLPKVLKRSKTGLEDVEGLRKSSMPENKPFLRDRSASIGTLNLKTSMSQFIREQNRTMLFQVGRSEIRLISPDRKQILLHRAFNDVASCVLGRQNPQHFGFVCRESSDAYACYVFKCESDSVATEVINAIKQAFIAHADLVKKSRQKLPNMTCEHCPMLWYHRLCHDVEGMNEKKTHAFILRRIEQLPDDEQETIITKYQGGTNHMFEVSEHNAFLMMLLRAHCEAKQQRHVHDTAENRSEFLNQYLGGNTIFMKAKRSLSSGFDHLLKRKASKDDMNSASLQHKKEPSPLPSPIVMESSEPGPEVIALDSRSKSQSPTVITNGQDSQTSSKAMITTSTDQDEEQPRESTSVTSPIMDIFLKVSDSRPAAVESNESETTWRQAIYEKVVHRTEGQGEVVADMQNVGLGVPSIRTSKRSKEQLKELWKMAIDQTILLVRMEKENARLKKGEETSAVRRIKLEYAELGTYDGGVMWERLVTSRADQHMLTHAVRQGVPRMSRGSVWYFLAEQACLRSPPPDVKNFPHYHTPYHTLLAGLTKHQHAILIDLGRTFPQHSYFASALGPGQLALYNILKAYSLLDPEVGYCQGLSFVAGVLLLHMEEAEAFVLLRHLMFRRGLRKQYLPDMSALQVQLYQLSRLLRDHEPELYEKLELLDISPALYAAPWMLTLFTSQFPLGFVVRVFDLIFLESLDVVFAVSLALLIAHKDGLMLCESCEEAAEYLKHKLPDVDKGIYEKVMKKVHSLDISRQLNEYAVEYAVLREEMPRLSSLTTENAKLVKERNKMAADLDMAMDAITNYQNYQARIEAQNKIMTQQLTLLSRYISANQKQEMPNEIKKIVQTYSKKLSFSSKIFASKFTGSDEDVKPLRTEISSPNLFLRISKEEMMNSVNKDKNIENDRKHFMMRKSQSVHSGLIVPNLKSYPLKILDESGTKRSEEDKLKDLLKEVGKKNTGFFANSHEQIRQERLFEQQLKNDFDENLKKLDEKLKRNSYIENLDNFQSKKSMSLNLNSEIANDSGFVTPISPSDKKDDTSSVVSHPLSDSDVDIKLESTTLKQIRPIKHLGSRNVIF